MVILLLPAFAGAHQGSATYAELSATERADHVSYRLRIPARDLGEALELGADRVATARDIRGRTTTLFDYVDDRIEFSADGRACVTVPNHIDTWRDGGQLFAQLDIGVTCPAAIGELVLEYDLFFDLDPQHIGFVTVAGSTVQLEAPDDTRLVWTIGSAPGGGFGQFLVSGIEHIVFGLDHVLFLLGLLLVAVVARPGPNQLRARRPREALAYAALLVSSFTVAHSVTLIAAALGWINLPSRLVETVIAASIVFVAIDNVIRVDPPHRYLVTFVFGLVHGLGFASMLRPLLPDEAVVVPLFAFNLGVEVGQLALVAIGLPLLLLACRAAGIERYRRVVLPLLALALAALGTIWLVERAFEVELLGL